MRVQIKRGEFERAAMALDNLTKWIRPGTLAARFGAIRGILVPMAQGVYYDREALIDEHALYEGEGAERKRVSEPITQGGQVVGETVKMRDQQAFNRAQREMMESVETVELPYLIEEKHLAEIERVAVKDQMNLPAVDFGALNCIRAGFAKTEGGES